MTTPAPSGPPVDQRHGAIVEVLVHNSLIRRHPNSSAKTILEAADAADRAAGVVRVDTTVPSPEQVDRCARVMFARDYPNWTWDEGSSGVKNAYRINARTTLAALRETP